MARKKHEKKTAKNGANLGFEPAMWQAADKLRGNMDASDYKHVVLGLIFLKYISDAFEERHAALKSEPHADPEDPPVGRNLKPTTACPERSRRVNYRRGGRWGPEPGVHRSPR
jgi:type I restriction-modification system DNA methylase subunit